MDVRDNPAAESPVRLMETYIAPYSSAAQNSTSTTTTTQSTNDESTNESTTNGAATNEATKDNSTQDVSMNDQTTNLQLDTTNNTSPPPIERQFSIYTASYKEMPVMHRPYTNQYKFLVKDFCIHFLNK